MEFYPLFQTKTSCFGHKIVITSCHNDDYFMRYRWHSRGILTQLKFRKYNYILMQKPFRATQHRRGCNPRRMYRYKISPLWAAQQNLPPPSGLYYSTKYNGGSRPRLYSDALAGLLPIISTLFAKLEYINPSACLRLLYPICTICSENPRKTLKLWRQKFCLHSCNILTNRLLHQLWRQNRFPHSCGIYHDIGNR